MNVFVLNTREDILKNVGHRAVFLSYYGNQCCPKQPDYTLSSEYLPLCSEQTHSYRSGDTWGWVNDDRIFIFGWTVPLNERWGERSIQTEGWRHCLHGQGFYARFVFVVYLHSEMITDERASDTTWKSKQCYQHIHRVWNRRKKTFSAVWEYMWELYGFLSTPNLIRDHQRHRHSKGC